MKTKMNKSLLTILAIVAALLLPMPATAAGTQCKYETRIRSGLIWYNVTLYSDEALDRETAISRFAEKYRFQDIGYIYNINRCAGDWRF